MPSVPSIADELNAIANAQYGNQVRSSIISAISKCYGEISSDVTLIASAINECSSVTADAEGIIAQWDGSYASKFSSLDTLYNDASNKVSQMSSIIQSWTSGSGTTQALKDQISAAVGSANEVYNLWTYGSGSTPSYESRINSAISRCETVIAAWYGNDEDENDSLSEQVQTAIASATAAYNAASAAAGSINSIINSDWPAISLAFANIQNLWNGTSQTTGYEAAISAKLTQMSLAVGQIDGMTVEAYNNGMSAPTVSVTSVDGHKHIVFGLQRGETGPAYNILGEPYATLSDLEAATSTINPSEGDQYQVGSEVPYDVYRWTGTRWLLNEDGSNASFAVLSENDINNLWAGNEIQSVISKFMDHGGFHRFIGYIKTLIGTKVDKVEGKGLSQADFTSNHNTKFGDPSVTLNTSAQNLVGAINELKTNVTTLNNTTVQKVEGKGLSQNDFTNAYVTKLNGINAASSSQLPLANGASAVVGISQNYARADHVHPYNSDQILYFSDIPINGSVTANDLCVVEDSRITSNTVVLDYSLNSSKNIISDIQWLSTNGSITFTGSSIEESGVVAHLNVVLGLSG